MKIKELEKHPQWKSLFEAYIKKDSTIELEMIKKCFEKITQNKQIFKGLINDAYAFLKLEDNRSIMERLEDKVDFKIHKHKKQQFIKSLKTKKYNHLFNEQVEKEIDIILDNKISIKALKSQFFSKLARYQNQNKLLEDLKEFKEKNINWTRSFYLEKIKKENLNVTILNDQNGYMLIQVNDYKACKEIGSQAWCIVEDEHYFNDYLKNNFNRQIIAFNFDLDISDNRSIIGLTMGALGIVLHSYLKDDENTPKEICSLFNITPLSNKDIKEKLNLLDDQLAFELICENNLTSFYEEYINKKTVDPSYKNNKAFILAVCNNHYDLCKNLIKDTEIDPSSDDNFALSIASELGHIDIVKLLIKDRRVDPSDYRNDAVMMAAINGQLETFKVLMEDKRVNPFSHMSKNPIKGLIVNSHIEILKILLNDKRLKIPKEISYAIKFAVENDSHEVLEIVLANKKICSQIKNKWKEWFFKNLSPKHKEILKRTLSEK